MIYMCIHVGPQSPPQNVSAMALSPTSIMVTWEAVAPIDQNGIITTYDVLYEPSGGQFAVITELFVILDELEEYVMYNISVRANTNAGAGPYSDAVFIITPEDSKDFLILFRVKHCIF